MKYRQVQLGLAVSVPGKLLAIVNIKYSIYQSLIRKIFNSNRYTRTSPRQCFIAELQIKLSRIPRLA